MAQPMDISQILRWIIIAMVIIIIGLLLEAVLGLLSFLAKVALPVLVVLLVVAIVLRFVGTLRGRR